MKIADQRIDKSKFDNLVPLNVLSEKHREELRQSSRVLMLDPGEAFGGAEKGDQFTYYLVDGHLGLYVGKLEVDESLKSAIGDKVYAEEQAQLAAAAKSEVESDKEPSREALDEACEQISRLRRQGLLD
ncbi:MAG: hypothetical protein CMO26_07640 [Thiotrichales bacterium]|nr:hypothetical protein [Thiotrichales bacterium]|tara:strand:+ start:523 stop:909 length:387 start_codon:yes stop_codon:yes gene_type:complete